MGLRACGGRLQVDPEASFERILSRARAHFPEADEAKLKKALGMKRPAGRTSGA